MDVHLNAHAFYLFLFLALLHNLLLPLSYQETDLLLSAIRVGH